MIGAIVLAGGLSRRMGRPKPLLAFEDSTFIERIVSVLRGSKVDSVAVVLGAKAHEVIERTDLAGVEVVINDDYEQGQLSSLIAGLNAVGDKLEAAVVALVDNPFVTAATVDLLVNTYRDAGAEIVLPVYQGRRGHPVLFAASMFEQLIAAPVDRGARYVVHANAERVVEVRSADDSIHINIDTPDDYHRFLGSQP